LSPRHNKNIIKTLIRSDTSGKYLSTIKHLLNNSSETTIKII